MTKYRVWGKWNDKEDDAIEIDASDAVEAAFEWTDIKKDQGCFNRDFTEITVYVSDKNGECLEQTIYVACG